MKLISIIKYFHQVFEIYIVNLLVANRNLLDSVAFKRMTTSGNTIRDRKDEVLPTASCAFSTRAMTIKLIIYSCVLTCYLFWLEKFVDSPCFSFDHAYF